MVPCLFPSGGMILNAVAEINASEFLVTWVAARRPSRFSTPRIRQSAGTLVAVDANKRLESLK